MWQRLRLPPLTLFAKFKPVQPAAQPSEPIVFVEVNPAQATTEAPKNAKYYSNQNSRAANPEANRDTKVPELKGTQTEVAKTENAPRPEFNKLQPAMPLSQKQQEPQLTMNSGDLTLGKPQEQQPRPRPRTLKQALAEQHLPGLMMKQKGGVPREELVPSLDVKATPFGAYDAAFIQAVSQHWYDLLDSRQFARDRSGKVVLRFHLNYDGRISDMKVVQNTVGDLLCYVCQKAIMDPAPYARWPTDMRELVGADYREITFTFYYY